jgi:hypothetical protein
VDREPEVAGRAMVEAARERVAMRPAIVNICFVVVFVYVRKKKMSVGVSGNVGGLVINM